MQTEGEITLIIYKAVQTDMMGFTVKEAFFDSKNKAKKALRKMIKAIKHELVQEGETTHLSVPIEHCKSPILFDEKTTTYQVMAEVWVEYGGEEPEWDQTVLHFGIEKIMVS